MAATWPVLASRVRITSTNKVLRIQEDSAAHEFDVTLTEGDCYLYGAGTESGDLCKALKDALDTASTASGAGNTYTVTYTALNAEGGRTGEVTIATDGTNVNLLGGHANTTLDLEFFGFFNVTSGPFASFNGYNSPKSTWSSNQPLMETLPDAPEADDGATHFTPSGVDYAWLNSDVTGRRTVELDLIVEDRVRNNFPSAAFGDYWRALYSYWRYARGKPLRLYHEDEASSGVLDTLSSADLLGTYTIPEHLMAPPRMEHDDDRLYRGTLKMREHVS